MSVMAKLAARDGGEPSDAEKIRSLPWINAFGATNAIFCTFTVFGSVFVLFLNELNLPKAQIGFVLSLIPFCLVLALFLSPLVEWFGVKRTLLTFWGVRKLVVALLLLTPAVLGAFGQRVAFHYVAGVVLAFGLCRAVAMTAWLPWSQQTVPDSIRGKFQGVHTIISTIASAAAVLVAGYVIGRFSGLSGFMGLMAVGVLMGILSTVCMIFVPGGAARREPVHMGVHLLRSLRTLRDRNFLLYLLGYELVNLGSALLAFVPLYMSEKVGLPADRVVYLQAGSIVAILLSSYPWGWAADRYGSKPVMLAGLIGMLAYPPLMALLPRNSQWSMPAALGLSFLYGITSLGYNIGVTRYLYVSVIPPRQRMTYSGVYQTWNGIVQGIGPLLAGSFLDACRGIEGRLLIFPVDGFTLLFAANFLLTTAALVPLARLKSAGELPTATFVSMFFQGNPLAAFESLVRYSLARGERGRVSMTERLGQAKSPLTVEELIEALSDPSFNVRYEAIISIGRTRPHPRLMEALTEVLEGPETDLSTAAAHAFARIGDRSAIPALRRAMAAGHPILQARCARALGTLGDTESVSAIMERFRQEQDETLKLAYASALGSLRAVEAAPELLSFLRSCRGETARMEVALALARLVDDEDEFIGLWRDVREEGGTAIAQALTALQRDMIWPPEAEGEVADCAGAAARGEMKRAGELLGDLIKKLPADRMQGPAGEILRDCATQLVESDGERMDYFLLALHTLRRR